MNETQIIRLERESDLYTEPPRPLTRDVYWTVGDNGVVSLAHVCLHWGRREPSWFWQTASAHRVVSLDPLHLEPSIGWMNCCGRHGFIRGGKWEPAGDGGWQPVDDQEGRDE